METYELLNIDINTIKFDGDNPNVMTPEQEASLRESMQEFGFLTPVIIDQNNVVADGEHRVKIYKQFGMKTIQGYKLDIAVL